jgi:hypothetical protein
MVKAKATKRMRQLAYCKVKEAGLQPAQRITIDVQYAYSAKGDADPGYKPRDEDNAIAAIKAYLDGIKDSGLVKDDSRKHVRIREIEITVKTKKVEGPQTGVWLNIYEETE